MEWLISLVLVLIVLPQIEGFPAIFNSDRAASIPFDPVAQAVDVSGPHAFQAPGQDDQRGPCPALNAMANHNYLPHNGVATIDEYIDAQMKVFQIGNDIATVLALFGALFAGNLADWSIGGTPPGSLPLIQGYGLSFTHNKYEGDASPTRGDLYEYGNDYKVVLDQFKALYSQQPDSISTEESDYTFDMFAAFRNTRIQQSIENNPDYFSAPLPGTLFLAAAYALPPRCFANHSAERPDGYLDRDVLKYFFSINGDDIDSLQYTEGHESIPSGWYKLSPSDPYNTDRFFEDFQDMVSKYPQFIALGGNTGTPNSFTGVDVGSLTNGVYNSKDLADPTKAFCFAFQFKSVVLPQSALGVIAQVKQVLMPFIQKLGCPELDAVDTSKFNAFPGWTKLKADGTY